MRHSLRLIALALTVATTALLAPVAHADPPPPHQQSYFWIDLVPAREM